MLVWRCSSCQCQLQLQVKFDRHACSLTIPANTSFWPSLAWSRRPQSSAVGVAATSAVTQYNIACLNTVVLPSWRSASTDSDSVIESQQKMLCMIAFAYHGCPKLMVELFCRAVPFAVIRGCSGCHHRLHLQARGPASQTAALSGRLLGAGYRWHLGCPQ